MIIRTDVSYDENDKPIICKDTIIPVQTSDEMFKGIDDNELHDPDIEYDSVPVEIHKVYHRCPKCKVGYMEFAGLCYPVNPPLYEHRCNKCGYVTSYHETYPSYVAVEVSD